MTTDVLISVDEIELHHNIAFAFIDSLSDFGLVDVVITEGRRFLPEEQLHLVERFIRLHYELGINVEGIVAIAELQGRIEAMQEEMMQAHNRLRLLY